ncbi:jg19358 [Pararge aegeria aegeria]|uniref:Elongation of very long chain fatty acids protein n=1 Tax=Pararge aegeria aegeria TaxID=348720 RepID=A0A8S4R6J3_9NEOP|nr:jg19358 [Pararge aegeria aegeria]
MASLFDQPLLQNGKESRDLSTIQTWTFEETFLGLAVVILSYLFLVLRLLPNFMKNRKPFQLKNALLFYNIFQVAFASYAVFLYTRYIVKHGVITTRCPKGEDLKAVISEITPYFIAKHIDLLDTVFFVLRKKENQVTFLHVFHHTLMLTWAWFYQLYYPADHFVVVGLINSFVHVLMYAYYGISSLGPEYAKYVWWKKHLTKVQLSQSTNQADGPLDGEWSPMNRATPHRACKEQVLQHAAVTKSSTTTTNILILYLLKHLLEFL